MSSSKTIITRVHKNSNYTNIDNKMLRNEKLSLKAKGLLSLLLTFDERWEFHTNGIQGFSKDGKDGVGSGLRELEENNYLIRTKTYDEDGRFDGMFYDIFESPYTEKPSTEKPLTEKPSTENPSNKNKQPQEITTQEVTTQYCEIDEIVDEFHKIIKKYYPEKTSTRFNRKVGASKLRTALNNKHKLEDIKRGYENYLKSNQGNSIQYVMKFETFMNKQEWLNFQEHEDNSSDGIDDLRNRYF